MGGKAPKQPTPFPPLVGRRHLAMRSRHTQDLREEQFNRPRRPQVPSWIGLKTHDRFERIGISLALPKKLGTEQVFEEGTTSRL